MARTLTRRRRSTRSRSSAGTHGGEPATAFSATRSGRVVAGMTRSTRGSESAHFRSACAQVSTPNARRGSSSRRGRLATEAQPVAPAEGPHDDHGDAQLRRERQDSALGLALERVERDLHGSKRPVRSASSSSAKEPGSSA